MVVDLTLNDEPVDQAILSQITSAAVGTVALAVIAPAASSLVERFSAATDTGARKELMEQLLYAWAGVRDRNPVRASYNGYGNGLQIAVLGGLNNGCADHYVINQQWRKALR